MDAQPPPARALLGHAGSARRGIAALLCTAGMALAIGPQGQIALSRVEHLALPVYVDGRPEPVAVVRTGTVSREHQKWGFWAIGALPVVVVTDAVIELADPAGFRAATAALESRLEAGSAPGRVECRGFTLRLAGNDRVVSARATQLKAGGWRLSGGVTLNSAGARWSGQSAYLDHDGDAGGGIVLRTPQGTHLLSKKEL
jgi:hypothetical protein